MTVPRCTVVVPTHGRPGPLRACLARVAAQEYPRERYEVVVVEDGGAPVGSVIDDFRGRLSIGLVRQSQLGPGAARNAGAAEAEGDLLVFTDDDCLPRPDWLRRLAGRFVTSSDEGVGGRTVNAPGAGLYARAAQLVIDVGYRQNNSGPHDRRWFTTNNLAVPAEGFRALSGFDPSYRTAEDRDFCARWTASGRGMSYEPNAIVEHASQLTLRDFVALHFRYGRGAYRFHRRHRPNGTPLVEPGYYLELAREPFRREPASRAVALEGLLAVWHLANTTGFAWAALHDR